MLGEYSRVVLISTSFVSFEVLRIGLSAVQLGNISIKSSVCAFSFIEYDSILLCFFFTITLCSSRSFKWPARKSELILTQSFIFII